MPCQAWLASAALAPLRIYPPLLARAAARCTRAAAAQSLQEQSEQLAQAVSRFHIDGVADSAAASAAALVQRAAASARAGARAGARPALTHNA